MSDNLKKKTISGIAWSAMERFSVQGIQFIVMLIMARMLTPKDYGIVGMLSIFLAVSQSLIDSGFSNALVRKQNRDDIDNSTVFIFNTVISLLLYALLFFFAPFIASFYNTPELTNVTRVIGLIIIFTSLTIVQRSIFVQKLDFKTQAKASLIAAVLSGVTGIYLAYRGFSYWSLVVQTLLSTIVNTIILWIYSTWKPRLCFSMTSFKELFSFGSKLLVTGILERIYQNVYPLIIGKAFSSSHLGYYTRAHNFSDFPTSNFTGILMRVTYPVMCNFQNDNEPLKIVSKKFLKLSAYIIFPLMFGMVVLAKPLVISLVGEQWEFSADLLQIISFQMIWYPINALNGNILQVKGRSDMFLKAEVIKKTICIILIVIAVPMGIEALCVAGVIGSVIGMFVNAHYTKKVLGYTIFQQLFDLLPIILLSMAMALSVYFITISIEGQILKLIIGTTAGIIVYLALSYIFKLKELNELKTIRIK